MAESRLNRLHENIGEERWQGSDLSEGETIAMSWVCEMTALAAAAETANDRVMWLNFESFLEQPAALLSDSLRHFGVDASQVEIDSILVRQDMDRYSKAPEHPYDAALRRDVLKQARQEHTAEIGRGCAWLDTARLESPAIPASAVSA